MANAPTETESKKSEGLISHLKIPGGGPLHKVKNVYFLIFLALQAIVLTLLIVLTCVAAAEPKVIETSLDSWSSQYAQFKDGAWYIDDTMVPSEDPVFFIDGPGIKLSKGSYLITVDYDITVSQNTVMYVNSDDAEMEFIKSGKTWFYPFIHSASSQSFRRVFSLEGNAFTLHLQARFPAQRTRPLCGQPHFPSDS